MDKQRVLISWVGGNDLNAIVEVAIGPIASTLESYTFDSVELLCSYPATQVEPYLAWLRERISIPVKAHYVVLTSPVHFAEIYQAANQCLKSVTSGSNKVSVLLSPGTPAMQAVWILLGKTRFNVRFYQASKEQGVEQVDVPFSIAAEYVPLAEGFSSNRLMTLAAAQTPVDAAFDTIVTQSPSLMRLKQQAQILASKQVPVLITGETGTGKELFARAIHNASSRATQPFVAINCAALAPELLDSTLFGHKKGAFTGAVANHAGVFQQAHGGTLFLDEFAELSAAAQVRLLRVLQEGELTPVGASQSVRVDVRLIAATHRNLMQAVANGHLREDLFYRVAVGLLHLPPLREREGDLLLLADHLMARLAQQDSSFSRKKLSVSAKKFILLQPWRGNIRELQSTLLRAALWSAEDELSATDIQQALLDQPDNLSAKNLLDIAQGIDLPAVIADVARQYLHQALQLTGHNKTRAAQLLGLKSQQTLSNWMHKYGID